MKARNDWATRDIFHDTNYPHFPGDTGLAHTEAFPWDGYSGVDRKTRTPKMIKSGEYDKFLVKVPAPQGGSKSDDTDPVQGSDSSKDNDEPPQGSDLSDETEHSTDTVSEQDKKTGGDTGKAKVLALPDDLDPWQYFDEQQKALLNDPTVAAAVKKMRTYLKESGRRRRGRVAKACATTVRCRR
jgi:hypothetical protein